MFLFICCFYRRQIYGYFFFFFLFRFCRFDMKTREKKKIGCFAKFNMNSHKIATPWSTQLVFMSVYMNLRLCISKIINMVVSIHSPTLLYRLPSLLLSPTQKKKTFMRKKTTWKYLRYACMDAYNCNCSCVTNINWFCYQWHAHICVCWSNVISVNNTNKTPIKTKEFNQSSISFFCLLVKIYWIKCCLCWH